MSFSYKKSMKWLKLTYLHTYWFFKNPCIKRLTVSEYNAERFCSEILKTNSISNELLDDILKRIKEVRTSVRSINITNYIIFSLLLLSVYGININFTLQGVKLDMTGEIREILFFISNSLFLYSFYRTLPSRLLENCLKKALRKSNVPTYERYKYQNITDFIIDFNNPSKTLPFSYLYKIWSLFLLLVVLLYALSFLIFFLWGCYSIGIEIYQSPSLSEPISYTILTYNIITIGCLIFSEFFFFVIPFRHMDVPSTEGNKKIIGLINHDETTDFKDLQFEAAKHFYSKDARYKRLFFRLAQ